MGMLLNLAVFVVAIGVGIWFVSLAINSFDWQVGGSTNPSNSLTESELRSMIEETVEDIVEEKMHRLEGKLDRLSRRLDDKDN